MDDQPTLDYPGSDRTPDPQSADGARFVTGTVLAGRYRIIDRIGRGGMGEVYRAEDLRLGEPVALKFLPARLSRDGGALARLHREVRTARKISHPNVVRVHDIGESEGETFLSMELVSGEDLSSLIERIGRLPEEKGVALARQICAGLAAAHEKGVLHRDLKPSNILVDGKGNARITDFGIAELISERQPGVIAGTPAYMAPEQLAGKEVSVASEFFSLGLVLYEIFTGKRFYEGASLAELREAHRRPVDLATSQDRGLDPVVANVIERCLALEPGRRPRSAMAIAAALPGGDPLLAALEAGETPSPEMVAEAEVEGLLAPRVAYSLLAAGTLLLLTTVALRTQTSGFRVGGADLEPAVLDHRAAELLEQAGGAPLTRGIGRYWMHEAYRAGRSVELSEVRQPSFWPPLITYTYRAGEDPIAPVRRWRQGVYWNEPPVNTPGTALVEMDAEGSLLRLLRAPTSGQVPSAATQEPDWTSWFEASGLEPGGFKEVDPTHVPPIWADRRWAWEGTSAQHPGTRLRVVSAARGPRVVQWEIREAGDPAASPRSRVTPVGLMVFFAMLLLGSIMAWRNHRSGRGDPRGALATAAVGGGLWFVYDVVADTPSLLAGGLGLFFQSLALGLVVGATLGAAYLALEPTLRRHLPHTLVSWNRLLRARFSDPLLARDLLLGGLGGLVAVTTLATTTYLRGLVDLEFGHGAGALWGLPVQIANTVHPMAMTLAVGFLFLFAIPRVLIPWSRSADVIGSALLLALALFVVGPDRTVVAAVIILIARWVGLTGLFAFALCMVNVALVPVAFDLDSWWAPTSLIGPAAILALLIWSAQRTARRTTT